MTETGSLWSQRLVIEASGQSTAVSTCKGHRCLLSFTNSSDGYNVIFMMCITRSDGYDDVLFIVQMVMMTSSS